MTIQDVKQFWDERPCNVRHSEIDIDTDPVGYSRAVSAKKFKVEPHLLKFMEPDRWARRWVLDVGCGIGTTSIALEEAGAAVIGVDLSSQSLDIARKRATALGLKTAFREGNIEKLREYVNPFPFSMVLAWGVIHHTPDPQKALKTLRKYGDLHTTYKIMLYHRVSWKALWILLTYGRGQFWRWGELLQRHSEAQSGCPVTHSYTRKSAHALLESAGYEIMSMAVEHIFPYQVMSYIQGLYIKEWYWRLMPLSVFRWLERRLGWHLLIEARLKRT